MTINANKIRLGAADSMIVQMGQTQYDLGATQGGVMFNVNSTILQIEIDQSIMPLQAFRTKEEISLSTTLLQIQMNLVNLAFGYAGISNGVTTVAAGTLGTPATPSLAVVGSAGAVTYTYKVIGFSSNGDSLPSTAATTAVGPTTLTSVNYVTVTHAGGMTGAAGYKVERTAGGGSTGIIATIYGNQPSGFVVNDTGLVGTAYTDLIASNTYSATDSIKVGGLGGIPSGTMDVAIPKANQTNDHIRIHLNKVVSYKAIKIDFARDKVSSTSGCEFLALADTSQPVGQQGFQVWDEGPTT